MNYYNEHDPGAAAWLRQLIEDGLIPQGHVDERDIQKVQANELRGYTQHHFFCGISGWPLALQLAGWRTDEPVCTGSPPCQPFSVGGNQEGTRDHRDLWPVWFNIIREFEPPVVLMEQVVDAIRWGWLDRLAENMEAEDYAIGSAVLPANSKGAWHVRNRLFVVATHAGCQRRPRLEQATSAGKNGSWWPNRQKNMPLIFDSPFRDGASWPQPLLRSVDDGVPWRVGGCHGAGNAIVPQVAAEFIISAVEAIKDLNG
jgi:DNA (cytosine-5)-methyltransferase 1